MTAVMTDDMTIVASAAAAVVSASVDGLLRQRADLPVGDPYRGVLRTRSIQAGLPFARRLAARYRGRGESLDDLYQVAALALVKAVDGYDPTRQVAFVAYATPSILGELKRYFRDCTWWVRVPRPVQELAISLNQTSARLTQQLRRRPSRAELAADLGVGEDDIAAALNAWKFRYPGSLDAPAPTGGEQQSAVGDGIGDADPRFEEVIDRHSMQPLIAALPERERHILTMRFWGGLTQAEIAAQVGVSQMHISRLLTRALTHLRNGLLGEPPSAAQPV